MGLSELFETEGDKKKKKAASTLKNAEANNSGAGSKYQNQASKSNAETAASNKEKSIAQTEKSQSEATVSQAHTQVAQVRNERAQSIQKLSGTAYFFVTSLREYKTPVFAGKFVESYELPTDKSEFIKVFTMIVDEAYRAYTFLREMQVHHHFYRDEFVKFTNIAGNSMNTQWYVNFDPDTALIKHENNDWSVLVYDRFWESSSIKAFTNYYCNNLETSINYFDILQRKLKDWETMSDTICPKDPKAKAFKELLASEVNPKIDSFKKEFRDFIADLQTRLQRLVERGEGPEKEKELKTLISEANKRHDDNEERSNLFAAMIDSVKEKMKKISVILLAVIVVFVIIVKFVDSRVESSYVSDFEKLLEEKDFKTATLKLDKADDESTKKYRDALQKEIDESVAKKDVDNVIDIMKCYSNSISFYKQKEAYELIFENDKCSEIIPLIKDRIVVDDPHPFYMQMIEYYGKKGRYNEAKANVDELLLRISDAEAGVIKKIKDMYYKELNKYSPAKKK